MDTLNVAIRSLLILILLFFLFKLMGKKQVSQMSMFDYITGITIGSVVADISLDIEKDIIAGITCILIYCILDIFISYLSLKSVKLRNFFNGREVSLMKDGNILRENMGKNKININILETEARLAGHFDLNEVNNAILEPSGMISFELKDKYKNVTKKDMNLQYKNSGLVYNLIIDGEIINENLEIVNKNKKWLDQQLKVDGLKYDDVLLFTINGLGEIRKYKK